MPHSRIGSDQIVLEYHIDITYFLAHLGHVLQTISWEAARMKIQLVDPPVYAHGVRRYAFYGNISEAEIFMIL